MSNRATDEFHALILNFEEATAAFKADESPVDNPDVEGAMHAAIDALADTQLVATTLESAMAALRVANSEVEDFDSTELIGPLVKGAGAYFDNVEAASGTAGAHAMNMASGLSLAGVKNDVEWLAIYDAIDMADGVMTAICNRSACIDGDIGTTAAGEYIDTIVEFLAWERMRVVDAARVFLSEMKGDPELLNKLILAHDVKYSEFGFKDISAQVASMSARYEEYKARRARRC